MRKLTIILLVFCLVISTANAAEFSAQSAYAWLMAQDDSAGSFNSNVIGTSWAILAMDKTGTMSSSADNSLNWVFSQQSSNYCFPASPCKTKDTAMAMLAMNKLQRLDNMSDIQASLQGMLIPSSLSGDWLIEVSNDKTGTCKLEWEINNQTKDKTVNVAAGRFTEGSNSYFLNVRDVSTSILNNPGTKISVDCTALEGGKVISLVYRSSNSYYILSSATGDKAELTINNGCFGAGPRDSSCKKDSSMYAAWAAKETGLSVDVKMYLMDSYSETSPEDNALLYLATKDARYLAALKQIQKTDGSFEKSVMKTAMAVLALKDDAAYSEQVTKATDWLKTKQKADGSLGTVDETAVALYAAFNDAVTAPSGDSTIPSICNNDGDCQADAGEDTINCPEDCTETEEDTDTTPSSDCNDDGICNLDYYETTANCPGDCSCGDGKCDDTESEDGSCEEDCASTDAAPSCGDGTCDDTETEESCAQDCTVTPTTGEGSTNWIIIALIALIVIGGGIFAFKKFGGAKPKAKPGQPGYSFPKPIGMPAMGPSKVPPMKQMTSRPSGFARPAARSRDEELDKSLAEARKLLGK